MQSAGRPASTPARSAQENTRSCSSGRGAVTTALSFGGLGLGRSQPRRLQHRRLQHQHRLGVDLVVGGPAQQGGERAPASGHQGQNQAGALRRRVRPSPRLQDLNPGGKIASACRLSPGREPQGAWTCLMGWPPCRSASSGGGSDVSTTRSHTRPSCAGGSAGGSVVEGQGQGSEARSGVGAHAGRGAQRPPTRWPDLCDQSF